MLLGGVSCLRSIRVRMSCTAVEVSMVPRHCAAPACDVFGTHVNKETGNSSFPTSAQAPPSSAPPPARTPLSPPLQVSLPPSLAPPFLPLPPSPYFSLFMGDQAPVTGPRHPPLPLPRYSPLNSLSPLLSRPPPRSAGSAGCFLGPARGSRAAGPWTADGGVAARRRR